MTGRAIDVFLSALPARLRSAPDADAALSRALGAARRAWPDYVDDIALARHLAHQVQENDELPAVLEQLHVADLALADACARGDVRAIADFERLYFGDLERAWRGRSIDASDLEDAKQLLRARLFVGEEDTAPKIVSYAGRGTLRGWMRAVIANQMVNVGRRSGREVPVAADDAVFAALPGSLDDLETAHMKAIYKDAFREAFLSALEDLSAGEKNVLRYRFAENLSVQQIAAIYGIHRETAGQRVAQARAALEASIRARLVARYRMSEPELRSVLRIAVSQIDVTLARVLR